MPSSPASTSSSIPSRQSTPTPIMIPNSLSGSRGETELQSVRGDMASDDSSDEDVEETIITEGARSISVRSVENQDAMVHDEDTYIDASHSEGQEAIMPVRHAGFPPPEGLPRWFPEKIKDIYRVDRHGGSLTYKELNAITRFRGLVEILRRRKWKRYLKAGKARWKLQKSVRRFKPKPGYEKFYGHQKKQLDLWKKKALQSWKKLERIHRGTLILDETINVNFQQERMIYAKQLAGLV